MGTEQRDKTNTIVAQRMAVGLSTIIGITVLPSQIGLQVSRISGGSLEIGSSYVLTAAGASTAFTWGTGWLVGGSEILNFEGVGTYYLAATGATAVIQVLRKLDD